MTSTQIDVKDYSYFADNQWRKALRRHMRVSIRLLIIPTLEPGKRAAQNVAAIDAAVRAGVKHIVFMSTAGARQEEVPALGASYWRGEQHLIATAPAWTILRMNFYAESFVQQAQASLGQGVLTGLAENRVAFVARGDVAAAAAGILIGDGHAGAIYNATGPERLSVRNAQPSSPKSLAGRSRSLPSLRSNCAPD